MKKNKTYWPYGIAVSIILVAVACILTINVALENPVEMDTFYFDKYQNVDENFNKIKAMEIEFDKKYDFILESQKLNLGANDIKIKLLNKENNQSISNAKVVILITRPNSSKADFMATPLYKNNFYILSGVEISKEGRWIIQTKIDIEEDNLTRFFKNELNTTTER